nr:hypothetical protein [Tanacetum cinerariifolium]
MLGLIPGYAGNPNNVNGWIKLDVPLLGEIGEPIGAKVDELMVDQVIDEVADPVAKRKEKEVKDEWLMVLVTPPLMSGMPSPSSYKVGGPSTAAEVSDDELVDGIAIREIGPRVFVVEGQAGTQRDEMIEGLSQQVQTLQDALQHRDVQIQQLQDLVFEINSHESTLMQCILGMDKRLVDL